MRNHPELLVPPGDAITLGKTISCLMEKKEKIDYGKNEGWIGSSLLFHEALGN
jgi:hypothetical protein